MECSKILIVELKVCKFLEGPRQSSVALMCVGVWQVEEPSMISDMEDAVDSRQWTQHHLAAADIRMHPTMALTPPQGEFDHDSMDVNVRGPGKTHTFNL